VSTARAPWSTAQNQSRPAMRPTIRFQWPIMPGSRTFPPTLRRSD
jgi:hypothetical protein